MAAIIGGILALGGSVLGGISSAKSAAKAADANTKNNQAYNQLLSDLFHQTRGGINPATGTANAILPEYFGNTEQDLGNVVSSYFKNYLSSAGSPASQYASANTSLDALRPAFSAAQQALLNRYNGQDLATRLGIYAPVGQANIDLANAQSNSIVQALQQQLGQQAAARARGGFFGGSSFENNLGLRSSLDALRNAAVTRAGAAQTNAANIAGLQTNNLNQQVDTSAPLSYLSNWFQAQAMPAASVSSNLNSALSPFNFFKIGTGGYTPQASPTASPLVNAGQIAGAGAGSVGTSLLDYGLKNNNTGDLLGSLAKLFGGG